MTETQKACQCVSACRATCSSAAASSGATRGVTSPPGPCTSSEACRSMTTTTADARRTPSSRTSTRLNRSCGST